MPHALPLVQGGTSYIAHLLNPRLSPVPPVTCTPLDTHFEGTGGTGGVQGAQGATGGVQKRVQGVQEVQPEVGTGYSYRPVPLFSGSMSTWRSGLPCASQSLVVLDV